MVPGPPFQIRYTRLAEHSFEDQAHHLVEQRQYDQRSALTVISAIIDDIESKLRLMPDAYPISPETSELGVTRYRRMLSGSFRVFYELHHQSREVVIMLVLHARQDVEKALVRYCLFLPLQ